MSDLHPADILDKQKIHISCIYNVFIFNMRMLYVTGTGLFSKIIAQCGVK